MTDLGLEAVAQGGFGLCEAPVVEADGTVWFSDVHPGGIFRIAPGADAIEEVVPKRRGVGGLAVHARGGVVASGRDVIRVAPDGTTETLWAAPEDSGITGFNDLAVDAHGWVVVGALLFKPAEGGEPGPGRLIVVADRFVAVAVDEGIAWPNGIGFSPDGRRAYVADFARGVVLAVAVDGQGALGEHAEVFATVPGAEPDADGLAVDVEGGVWVATGRGGGLVRFGPDGALSDRVDGIAPFVSSLAFGGADGRDVVVTTAGGPSGGAVLRGRAPVAGVPLTPARI